MVYFMLANLMAQWQVQETVGVMMLNLHFLRWEELSVPVLLFLGKVTQPCTPPLPRCSSVSVRLLRQAVADAAARTTA